MTVPSAITQDDATRLWGEIRRTQLRVENFLGVLTADITAGTAIGRSRLISVMDHCSDYIVAIHSARGGGAGTEVLDKVVELYRQETGDTTSTDQQVKDIWNTQRSLAADVNDELDGIGVGAGFPKATGGWIEAAKFGRTIDAPGDMRLVYTPDFPAANQAMIDLQTAVDALLADIV